MTTTPVATAATGQPEWARCRGRGERSLHCAFVARFPVVGSGKAGRIGLVYGRFSHQLEAHAAMLLAPIPLIMGNLGGLRRKDGRGPDGGGVAACLLSVGPGHSQRVWAIRRPFALRWATSCGWLRMVGVAEWPVWWRWLVQRRLLRRAT